MEQLLASQQKVEELTKENGNLQQKVQELTTENEQQKQEFDQQKQDFEKRIAQLQQEKEAILRGLDKKLAEEEEREMKVQLPLENWFDLLAFVPRRQLGNISFQIGDRKFARILQSFLHEHGEITLGRMKIIPPRLDVSSDRPMMRLGLRLYPDVFPYAAINLPDWPMPKNVKNFDEIILRQKHLDIHVVDFLREFRENSLLANVNLVIGFGELTNHNILGVLVEILPLISSIYSIEFCGVIELAINCGQDHLLLKTMVAQTKILCISWYRGDPNLTWEYTLDWCCSWLYTPREDGMPRALISNVSIQEMHCSSLIDRIKKDFEEANHPVSFFIRLIVPKNSQQEISLNNNKTNEKLVIKVEAVENFDCWNRGKLRMLISRHSSKAAKHRIEKDEKEISEWVNRGNDKQIYIYSVY